MAAKTTAKVPDNLVQRLDIDFALQAADLGVWEYNPAIGTAYWDQRCRQLYGLPQQEQISYQQAFDYIHPQDVPLVRLAVDRALRSESEGHYDITFRTLGGKDQPQRWVRSVGRAYFSPRGSSTGLGASPRR